MSEVGVPLHADLSWVPCGGTRIHFRWEERRIAGVLGLLGPGYGGRRPVWRVSLRFQPGTPLDGTVYAGGDADFAASPGLPADAEVIRGLLAAGSG